MPIPVTPSLWRSSLAPQRTLVWVLVLGLVVLFAVMRVIGTLGPANLRWVLPLGFVLMAAAPWILLTKQGRRQIGLRSASSLSHYAVGMLGGVVAACACFLVGCVLFGDGADHWFVSVAASYRAAMDTSRLSMTALYLIFTLPALLFSPIGEEIFFRGVLQRTLEQRLTVKASTVIECAAFGLVHLCHHGLALGAAGIVIRPLSGVLWVALMFLVAFMFAALRQRSGSLFPAMASHAAFNATMNVAIFAFLWN